MSTPRRSRLPPPRPPRCGCRCPAPARLERYTHPTNDFRMSCSATAIAGDQQQASTVPRPVSESAKSATPNSTSRIGADVGDPLPEHVAPVHVLDVDVDSPPREAGEARHQVEEERQREEDEHLLADVVEVEVPPALERGGDGDRERIGRDVGDRRLDHAVGEPREGCQREARPPRSRRRPRPSAAGRWPSARGSARCPGRQRPGSRDPGRLL